MLLNIKLQFSLDFFFVAISYIYINKGFGFV